ncbi:MAG: helix-turn-helix domain-containing protein [Desulfuromonadaceae bacterium]
MTAMGKGGKKTPEMVVKLINAEVAKNGQNATSRAMGLPLYSIQKYMAGTAEPTYASLKKIADYFEMPIAELRGENVVEKFTRVFRRLGEYAKGDAVLLSDLDKALDDSDDPRVLLRRTSYEPFEKHSEETWWQCIEAVTVIKNFPECREEFALLINKYLKTDETPASS